MVNREVVGAHYGLRDWLAQRLTAIVMALYTFLFVVVLVASPKLDYEVWRHLFSPQWMKLATLLFLLSVYYHAWVGIRNIFMDYVKHGGLRLALYALVIAALVAYTGWSVQILWSI
jgi:succinate dehydrogenase / fumarate reductase membrane anchor subunit